MATASILRSQLLTRRAAPLLFSSSVIYALRPRTRTLLCDSGAATSAFGRSSDYDSRTALSDTSYPLPQQISSGSVIGLLAGLGISTFSKSLSLIVGFTVIVLQWASSMGLNVLPWKRIQSYVKGVDVDRLVHENIAFKVAFGTSLAVATFLR